LGNRPALLEAEGARLLVDCGQTVPARLEEMGCSLRELDTIFVSHLHGDHVYGLEEIGFKHGLLWQTRPRLLIAAELVEPLWEHVLSGTMAPIGGRMFALEDYFDVVPLRAGKTTALGPWTLEIHPVVPVRT